MRLEAKQITYRYPGAKQNVLERVDFMVESHERVGIFAQSGRGKTTFGQLLAGYRKPSAGQILLDGQPLPAKGCCPVQMIWQHPEQAVNPRMKMHRILAEGNQIEERIVRELGIEADWLGRYPGELSGGELQRFCIARALGARILAEGNQIEERIVRELGIEADWLGRYPGELSGGELQRFCIARALGAGTRFLVADEISTMLDLITQSQIWHFLLEEARSREIGLVVISHDRELLERVCTRVTEPAL